MGLKINHIIMLENDENYIVLNETMHSGKKYFLAMKLNKKQEVISNSITILEEYVSGFETYVTIVVDPELIAVLTATFRAQVETA